MAPQIAHKHHRGHGKLVLGLWGSCYQDIPFVYSFTIRREEKDQRTPRWGHVTGHRPPDPRFRPLAAPKPQVGLSAEVTAARPT
jgi:hypothetical protein